MKSKLLVVVLSIFIITSCSLFEKDSFEGEWKLKIEGDYSGESVLVINNANAIEGYSNVSINGMDYEVRYKGKVSEEGDLLAGIEARGQQVGEMNGKLNYENGTGRWSAAGMGGTWSAVKVVE